MSVGGFKPITFSQPFNAQPSVRDDFQTGLAFEIKGDVDQAFIFYRKAAEKDNVEGQNAVSLCYLLGQGVAKDEVLSFQWLQKAADQDDAAAQNNLGLRYKDGIGVARNETEAFKWVKKAADQGNKEAQCNVGFFYESGIGVAVDAAAAVIWYKKAAQQGHCLAQLNLKRYYEANNDNKEASVWSNKMGAQVHEFLNDPEAPEDNKRIISAILNLLTEKR